MIGPSLLTVAQLACNFWASLALDENCYQKPCSSCLLALVYFVNHGAHHELLLLYVTSCRKHVIMNNKTFNSLWSRIHILCHKAILHEALFTRLNVKLMRIATNVNHGEVVHKDSQSFLCIVPYMCVALCLAAKSLK